MTARLHRFFAGPWTVGDLVAFHTAHKLLVMAHAPAAYGRLGRLIANPKALTRAFIASALRRTFQYRSDVIRLRFGS